jgi:hypothetical protein
METVSIVTQALSVAMQQAEMQGGREAGRLECREAGRKAKISMKGDGST